MADRADVGSDSIVVITLRVMSAEIGRVSLTSEARRPGTSRGA
ncbi:hypothetical protein FTUN_5306 [Frigoriglobus tundricola]|uniref:Uncharacterized protein n=1 Tax=Frigoriglobus tundricola TaxID=2774151 RepID=A0A6M5YUH0_9BACT|nr:hypothetical protein FTUN_5306 [Frigoriglobus tundricola]